MLKKLPIAITTFEDIRDKSQNYLYIDKTNLIYHLIDRGRYYFLSRPRRFGKSLLLDTMSDLFQGKKSLFEGLDIYDKWDFNEKYPVIRISFNSGEFNTEEGIRDRVFQILEDNLDKLKIDCKNPSSIPRCFTELVENANIKYKQKVVILVDEYDKPILDNITDRPQAVIARNILKVFYGVIKDLDKFIKFVFITGVSKFSKMNLFSGLNNLEDITIDNRYATICGYTHNDIKTTFKEHLKNIDLEKVKEWYNGYNYLGDLVYNPFDILLFISKGCEYRNYWWGTGNPSFLIEKLKEQMHYYIPDVENITTSEDILNSFDIERIDLIALLWQTGYLTFDKELIEDDELIGYKLKLPNKEIQKSLNNLFIDYLTDQRYEKLNYQIELRKTLSKGNLDNLKSILVSLFASIPYNNYVKNELQYFEGYNSSVIYTYLLALGFPCIPEDVTNKGRVDLTVKLPDKTVIFEFKVDSKEKALEQIKTKKYYEKFLHEKKDIFIVGICFDSEEKNITEFEWEKI